MAILILILKSYHSPITLHLLPKINKTIPNPHAYFNTRNNPKKKTKTNHP